MDLASIKFYDFYNSRLVKWSLRLFVALDLCLAFIEAPTGFLWFELPPVYTIPIEIVCLCAFVLQAVAKYRFLMRGRFFADKKNVAHLAVVSLQAIDIIVFVCMTYFKLHSAVRWSRFLRVWYVVYSNKSIRLAFRDIRNTIRDIVDVLFLEFLWVAFFAVMCTLLFSDLPSSSFTAMSQSFVSLYQLLTLVNFPGWSFIRLFLEVFFLKNFIVTKLDIMMPMYDDSRLWSLLFIVYITVGVFLLMNLVLAVVYNNYRRHFKKG